MRKKRSVKTKREPPQIKRLKTRVRNLKSELAESVPRTELESLRSTLEDKVSDLEARLAQSIPKTEAESLKEKAAGLESRLAEAERQLEAAKVRINELETKLAAEPAPT